MVVVGREFGAISMLPYPGNLAFQVPVELVPLRFLQTDTFLFLNFISFFKQCACLSLLEGDILFLKI